MKKKAEQNGMFSGMVVFFVSKGVQARRLQIWKQRMVQMGAVIEDRFSKRVTHVFAVDSHTLLHEFDGQRLSRFKGSLLLYQWLEDSLKSGEKESEDLYVLKLDPQGEGINELDTSLDPEPIDGSLSSEPQQLQNKKIKSSSEDAEIVNLKSNEDRRENAPLSLANTASSHGEVEHLNCVDSRPQHLDSENAASSLPYCPPDLNKKIIEIFGKLVNIYRALGEDRRSFSYYKAISVIEKLPFKIESADQIKNLPSIGKSMEDHIQEIITTGKLSKLEHFETDEKVQTISLFGEVWGIGPATALKLYEKGHRTLDDLRNDDSLTNAQKLGLKYFDDIRHRIPRHEVQEMEQILQKVGENVLPGVTIICGGSYRRGKATCGDIDIIVTHPDGTSHKGFLPKFVKRLKDMSFLREDLIYSTHSEEGTDSGVDTYFGFCTYPGRELRHRIDLKVYPRDIYAFGLVAWTGNDVLNRRLRQQAESKGFRLDDTGLFPAIQGSGGKRGTKGTANMKLYTEKEVFEFLGFPWLEPHERNL
ncbi:putative DNA-directed DNA polymerase [Medicago truncatula]|uniref:DNA polymerase n=1 Tax=Medicago truncatula TaxID=3880 RepID=A0A072TY09_MEDTR|nr:DNA polymerase lambda [Medicago truncatula]KEH22317.1 DNA polymerase lambda-like protein [Medicago truncatula]RHN45472.1 putative DNA-directed DNA polymerase [Medicago truncatula]